MESTQVRPLRQSLRKINVETTSIAPLFLEKENRVQFFHSGLDQGLSSKARRSAMNDEMKQLIEKAATVLKAAGAREVYVFGSAATQTMRTDSDIDIAVSGLPAKVFFRSMSDAEDALGRPVDLIDLDQDTPFTRYLRAEGELQRVG